MKQFFCLLLCTVILGTLAACGGQAGQDAGESAGTAPLAYSSDAAVPEGDAEGMPVHQRTAWQDGSGFDPETTAILVIDVFGGDIYGDAVPDQAVLNCFDIVKAGREAGLPILFVDDAHREGTDLEFELWGEHAVAGTPASQPLSGFDVQDSDYLLEKRRYDGFFQTDLDITLRELGVDTLIAFGMDTNICVLQTLSSAYYLGYQIIVPEDACLNTLGVGTHEDAIRYFDLCYGARIVSSKTILSEIQAAA